MWQSYINASSIDQVFQILVAQGERARIVAGATDLMLELQNGVRQALGRLWMSAAYLV